MQRSFHVPCLKNVEERVISTTCRTPVVEAWGSLPVTLNILLGHDAEHYFIDIAG